MNVKIKKEIIEELSDCSEGEVYEGFKLVEKTKWESEGKYEYRDVIFQNLADNKFYCYYDSRTGSYYSEYTYGIEDEPDEIECNEVVKKEITTYKWQCV